MVSYDYTSKCLGPYWSNPSFINFLTSGHAGAQDWAPECPNVEKINKGGIEKYDAERFGKLSLLQSEKCGTERVNAQ